MKSMTGYGRGEFQDGNKSFTVEIKTINHRYNDISIKMPKHISHFEDMIKKKIKEKVSRGRVEAYINMECLKGDDIEIMVDMNLAKSYKEASEKTAKELAISGELSLETIMKFPDVLRAEKKEDDDDKVKAVLQNALEIAITSLLDMRSKEGEKLLEDILKKLDSMEATLGEIEQRSPEIVLEYKERLNRRVAELLDNKYDLDEARLANEVAYFADKAGIDEEIVRLKSHISQARTSAATESMVGKKLDFIVQEMNRETNTIGSKVGDVDITNRVVHIKTEIEKIREQIQNVE